MVENSAYQQKRNKNKEVTSKPRRRPNPWRGDSMFRPPQNKNMKMKPLPVYLPALGRNNKKVTTNTEERLTNVLKTKNNIAVITNVNKPRNNRERAAQNLINRVAKYYTEYMQSNGPSSGASKILLKRAVYSLPMEAKVSAALIAASSVYGTAKFLKSRGKYVIPFILASLTKK